MERHRHRYEVNPEVVPFMESQGLKFVATCTENERMEVLEMERRAEAGESDSRRGSSLLRRLPVSSRIPEPTAEAIAALPGTGAGVCRAAGRLFSETLRVFVNKKESWFFYVCLLTFSSNRSLDACGAFRSATCFEVGSACHPLR